MVEDRLDMTLKIAGHHSIERNDCVFGPNPFDLSAGQPAVGRIFNELLIGFYELEFDGRTTRVQNKYFHGATFYD
jgi:hypothetical protein